MKLCKKYSCWAYNRDEIHCEHCPQVLAQNEPQHDQYVEKVIDRFINNCQRIVFTPAEIVRALRTAKAMTLSDIRDGNE